MRIPDAYSRLRGRVPFDAVALGYCAINLFKIHEIEVGQAGYSADASGNTIDSGWDENWLVIGQEDLCGNPIFIDVSDSLLPVFTAEHGEEEWQLEMIACSFRDFVFFLGLVSEVSSARGNPAALEANPLPEQDRDRILAEIAETGIEGDFWKSWLTGDSDAD